MRASCSENTRGSLRRCSSRVSLTAPGLAAASTASMSGSTLTYTASPSEANNIDVTLSGNVYTIHENGAVTIFPSAGCSVPSANTANCTAPAGGSRRSCST